MDKARGFQHSTVHHCTNYFITRIASDGKPTNDFKNLNTHAFPLFKAGHVQSIYVIRKDNSHNLKCICLPEMKKDKVYKINVTLDSCGDMAQASCACPAGAGPFGTCKHIGEFWKSFAE